MAYGQHFEVLVPQEPRAARAVAERLAQVFESRRASATLWTARSEVVRVLAAQHAEVLLFASGVQEGALRVPGAWLCGDAESLRLSWTERDLAVQLTLSAEGPEGQLEARGGGEGGAASVESALPVLEARLREAGVEPFSVARPRPELAQLCFAPERLAEVLESGVFRSPEEGFYLDARLGPALTREFEAAPGLAFALALVDPSESLRDTLQALRLEDSLHLAWEHLGRWISYERTDHTWAEDGFLFRLLLAHGAEARDAPFAFEPPPLASPEALELVVEMVLDHCGVAYAARSLAAAAGLPPDRVRPR